MRTGIDPKGNINKKKRGEGRKDWWVVDRDPGWTPTGQPAPKKKAATQSNLFGGSLLADGPPDDWDTPEAERRKQLEAKKAQRTALGLPLIKRKPKDDTHKPIADIGRGDPARVEHPIAKPTDEERKAPKFSLMGTSDNTTNTFGPVANGNGIGATTGETSSRGKSSNSESWLSNVGSDHEMSNWDEYDGTSDDQHATRTDVNLDPMNIPRALQHYMEGSGEAVTVPLESVGHQVELTDFPDFQKALIGAKPGDKIRIETSEFIDTGYLYGNFKHDLKGDLEVRTDGTWSFSGDVGGEKDIFDFNKGNRSLIKEAATWIGRDVLSGKPYDVYFDGRVKLEGSGER